MLQFGLKHRGPLTYLFFVYPVVGLKPNPISDLSLFENGMTQKIHCHPAFTAYLLLRLFQDGGRGFA